MSHAGKRAGLRPDTRSGLWSQMAYAIESLRPRLVVAENVRGLLSAPAHGVLESCAWCVGDDERFPLRALGAVLGDLAGLGYDAAWRGVRASDVGAPHSRFRVFVAAWPAADASGVRGERRGELGDVAGPPGTGEAHGPQRERHGDAADNRRPTAEDTDGAGREACGGRPWAGHPRRRGPVVSGSEAWGPYAPAVRRWERTTGRPAPAPTEPTPKGAHRLSARAVEWMMGLPDGWVTGVPGLIRNDQLKALGNGVVPQQAAHALRLLLADTPAAEDGAA